MDVTLASIVFLFLFLSVVMDRLGFRMLAKASITLMVLAMLAYGHIIAGIPLWIAAITGIAVFGLAYVVARAGHTSSR